MASKNSNIDQMMDKMASYALTGITAVMLLVASPAILAGWIIKKVAPATWQKLSWGI